MPPDVPELAIVLPFGSRTKRSMSSVGAALSVAFAAVTRIVTTKSVFGGTIVRANRSQRSMPLTAKQLSGFGAAHVRPAHVIVGESAEMAPPGGVAADTRPAGAIDFSRISVMIPTITTAIRFTSVHS